MTHQDILTAIREDNRSGAASLTQRGVEALVAFARDGSATSTDVFVEALTDLCRQLVAAQPTMAPMHHLASHVLFALIDQGKGNLESLRARAAESAEEFGGLMQERSEAVVRHAEALIAPDATVVTVSHSSAVREALLATSHRAKRPTVICAESRPADEGLTLTERLAEGGLIVTLVADAAVPGWTSQAQIALVGADNVSTRGVVNKTGTYGLALAARHSGVPLYALCGSEKFWPASLPPPHIEDKPPEELWSDPPPGVAVVNRYFETTPLALFAAVVTEDGPLAPNQVRQALNHLAFHPALLPAN